MTTDPGSRLAGRVTARPAEILLVEDSPSDAAMTVHALGTYHRVHVVGDGEAALAFLHRKGRYTAAPKPDLIPLDLNLPRVDGRDVSPGSTPTSTRAASRWSWRAGQTVGGYAAWSCRWGVWLKSGYQRR